MSLYQTPESFTRSVEKNIHMMQKLFEHDSTFLLRELTNKHDPSWRFVLFFIDGMANAELMSENIVEPLTHFQPPDTAPADLIDYLMRQVVEAVEIKRAAKPDDILSSLVYGDTILFCEGASDAIIIDTKSFPHRSVSEPENEPSLKGPREGFNETLMQNMALIRKKIRTHHLKMEFSTVGETTHTNICVTYIDDVVDREALRELKDRLSRFRMDGILDSNYLQEYIRDAPYSPFKTVGNTERPDIVAAKLLEGRIAVLVDGSPVALTVPFAFIEHFQANDDYYTNYLFSSVMRLLRVAGFFVTVLLPAVYVALITYHQEMIPTELIFSIAEARRGVPFPSVLEAFGMLVAFEILREAGTRAPAAVGQTLGIVGGLVLGQSAVEARLVSAPMLIIVAFSGVTALMVPRLRGANILLRALFLLAAALFGLYGCGFALLFVAVHLCRLRSFGVPVLVGAAASSGGEDILIRKPWFRMKPKGRYVAGRGRSQ